MLMKLKQKKLRQNSSGNWVILIFNEQKPCTRIISSIIAFFFTLFKGFKWNNSEEKVLIGAWENKLQNPQILPKWNLAHDDFRSFYLCFLNSCEIWNLFSWAPVRK